MSQTNQLVSKAIEMQQNTLENSQQAMEQAVEIPMKQTVELQKNAAKLFLNGLEMGSWAQNRGVELTRDAFTTYIDTVENAADNATQITEQGLQEANAAGHRTLQAGQDQFSTGVTGNGDRPAAYGQQPPYQTQQGRQPPQQTPRAPQQQAPQQQQIPPQQLSQQFPQQGQQSQSIPQQGTQTPAASQQPPQQTAPPSGQGYQQAQQPSQQTPGAARGTGQQIPPQVGTGTAGRPPRQQPPQPPRQETAESQNRQTREPPRQGQSPSTQQSGSGRSRVANESVSGEESQSAEAAADNA